MNSTKFFKYIFGFILVVLITTACKSDNEQIENNTATIQEVVLVDTLYGSLSDKQQYYQHFILEIPNNFQQNIDSLASWVVANEPGGLKFIDWDLDSISRIKIKLDTLDIIQPFYYSNYFEFLELPKYPYWDASTSNTNLVWTKVFSNDRQGIVDFGANIVQSDTFNKWLTDWEKESGINFITAKYQDKKVKYQYEKFIHSLRTSPNIIQLELTYFDTIQLNNYRKSNNYQGLFIVSTNNNTVNKQVAGGADFILLKMDENSFNSIPYKTWSIPKDKRIAFDESTKRILNAKSNLVKTQIIQSVKEQIKAVQLNLAYRSTSLLNNESKNIPLKPGAKIYATDKISINRTLKSENKFKINTQNTTTDFDKIIAKDGVKILVLDDSLTKDIKRKIQNLTKEQNTIICFSNPLIYPDIANTPNLVFFNKSLNATHDYSTLLQQLTGQLTFDSDFVLNDSLISGITTDKLKLARTQPEFCNLSADTLRRIDWAVQGALGGRAFPGCQVLIAKNGCIVYDKSFGHHSYDRTKPVTSASIYDLASLTKVVSTTLVGMKLYELNAYALFDSLQVYLPDSLKDHLPYPSTIRNITFQQLFTHKSGMPAGFPVIKYMQYTSAEISRFDQYFCDIADSIFTTEVAENFFLESCYQDSMWLKLNQIWLDPSKSYKYSDVNMNTLYFIFKSIIQNDASRFGYSFRKKDRNIKNLYVEFLYDKFYKALGMNRTKYKPLKHFNKNEIVPTENERYWRKQLLQGHVHDPNAALYGGIGGNAGIFSTTNDLAILGQMLLNMGAYDGKRYLTSETISKFTRAQEGSHRGLGFNKPSINTSAFGCAKSAPAQTYGHTGFTGTCIWVDPVNKLTYIFLSNRVNPTVNRRIYNYGIRGNVHQLAYDAQMF